MKQVKITNFFTNFYSRDWFFILVCIINPGLLAIHTILVELNFSKSILAVHIVIFCATLISSFSILFAHFLNKRIADNLLKIANQETAEKTVDEALLAGIADGLIATDIYGNITKMNVVASELLNLQLREGVVFPIKRVVPIEEEDGRRLKPDEHPINVVLKGNRFTSSAYYYVSQNGSRFPVAISMTPIKIADVPSGTIQIFREITEEKSVSRAKTEFVSLASHQLRTPLTAIKLFSGMLLNNEAGTLEPKQREYMNDISESTERMIRLVNDLLNVSRLEMNRLRVDPAPIQLENLVIRMINDLAPIADANNCKLIFKKPKHKLPIISFDSTLIWQVLSNIVSNSLKYSRRKECSIVIALDRTINSPKVADFLAKALPEMSTDLPPYVLFTVTDNGIGISKEDQKRIFEKFFRADNAMKITTEGSGLGLYVAKMITEITGGKIWFTSVVGEGSTFYVAFPESGMIAHSGSHNFSINNAEEKFYSLKE